MGWIAEALRKIRRNPPMEGDHTEALEDTPHCGCPFPPGIWGDSGWHFHRLTPALLYAREKRAFAKERPNMTREALRRAWGEWMAGEEDEGRVGADGILNHLRTYIGLPEAFERCPAYQASMAKGREAEARP